MSIKEYTVDEQYIAEELVEGPLNYISALGWDQEPPRLGGRMSHSSVGYCLKSVMMTVHGHKPSLHDPQSNRVLSLGTDLHRRMDDAQQRYHEQFGGLRVIVNNFRVESFGDELTQSITGTPDALILDWMGDKPTLWVLDYKTANDRSFESKCKTPSKPKGAKFTVGGASSSHKMQVAGYAGSDAVKALAQRCGIKKIVPAVVYLSKSNMKPFVAVVGPSWYGKALAYWKRAEMAMIAYGSTATLPVEGSYPEEGYQCSYCNMWPALPDKIWATLKEEKEARAELGRRNWQLCQYCDTPEDMREALLEVCSLEDLECLTRAE